MADRIDARPDHVAVAVPDLDAALPRWRDQLGGRAVNPRFDSGVFRAQQFRFRNGAKLELITPSEADASPGNFVRSFLARFGARVHHLTLKVPDLPAALDVLGSAGLDAVDVQLEGEHWKEAFLRPSQIGGLIVQVAWAAHSTDEWARMAGMVPETPPADGALLIGPRLRHPDLARARELWTLLGAEVEAADGGLAVRWEGSPIALVLEEGEPPGPTTLRMAGTQPLPDDPDAGPAVEPVSDRT